jgi:large subunit ribosomal protein L15
MQAHQLRPPKGATHSKIRVGRGNAAGKGTYAGKGGKGQTERSGKKPRRHFEGGQTTLMRRLPSKRGFTSPFRVEYTPVNLRDLDRFAEGAEVTPATLKEMHIITTTRRPVKLLGDGELDRKLTVRVHKFSTSAKEKIEAAGGTIEEITATNGNSQ